MYVQEGAQKFRWINSTFFRRTKIVLLYLYINQYVLTDLIVTSENFIHKDTPRHDAESQRGTIGVETDLKTFKSQS